MSRDQDRYPREVTCGDTRILLTRMVATDEPAVLAFARALPPHDLMFMRRDISQPKVLSAWVKEIHGGTISSLVAWHKDDVVGCTGVIRDPLSWSQHVGELRVVVAPSMRDHGLGRVLIQESFLMALGLGLEKLIAHMTVDQKGAIAVFEGMGFRPEALLRDHVRDPAGTKHDIVILSHDVAQFQAQMEAYGINDAF
jgi:RimJ/RimL family protein N-acetyltransferase